MIALALSLILSPAMAEEEAQPEPEFDLPRVELHRIPPTASFDAGVSPSFGVYLQPETLEIPWVGIAIRGGAGIHRGDNRWGGAMSVGFEGEVPMHFNITLEPQATWDRVSRGLLLGASLGPSVLVHGINQTSTQRTVYTASLAPSAAVRVGWSQPWTRVGRRLFVYLEPRVRYAHGQLAPTGFIAVGSGWGR